MKATLLCKKSVQFCPDSICLGDGSIGLLHLSLKDEKQPGLHAISG